MLSVESLKNFGMQNIQPWRSITPENVCAFSYTSGTNGEPKGAMITHRNIMVTCVSAKCKIDFNNKDIYLSYLPMAHVLERNVFYTMIWCKGKIGLYGGDI